jgi:MFS family permease
VTHRTSIPRTVWALGFVSLLMDVSSEIIHGLLPVFLTTTLGASVAMVGLIDGFAEATASITKLFSGLVSDRIGKRRPLILLGYALGALSKPLFAIAGTAPLILGARFADRIGKGIRGAPRDALIADITPSEIRGRAFGLRQSLDTVGAFAGPLIAIGLMAAFSNDFRSVFWVAFIPGALAVIVIVIGVRDPEATIVGQGKPAPLSFSALQEFQWPYWRIVILGFVFTLARFSEGFLILKAHAEGLPLGLTPLVLVAMNLVYAIGAYPTGVLSDRWPARQLLALGMIVLILADVVLALSTGLSSVFIGILLWGLHMALTQGLLSKLVADHAPPQLRGSAFGVFNLTCGVAMFIASIIAGLLWDHMGASATFLAGAGFSLAALGLICTTKA